MYNMRKTSGTICSPLMSNALIFRDSLAQPRETVIKKSISTQTKHTVELTAKFVIQALKNAL